MNFEVLALTLVPGGAISSMSLARELRLRSLIPSFIMEYPANTSARGKSWATAAPDNSRARTAANMTFFIFLLTSLNGDPGPVPL